MMKRLTALVLLSALVVLTVPGVEAARKLRVVATIPDLKALTEAVGGDLLEADSLSRGSINAHEIEIRPSMMLKLRRADIVVENGLELDRWIDVAVQGSNNENIVRGGAGVIDVSRGIPVLEVPTVRVDRSMGDVHPLGNPHYSLDPGLAPIITQNILEGLSRAAPEHRATFERNRQAFLAQLESRMAEWTKLMEPVKGSKVVVYHPQWIYFLTRFGLIESGWVEERPGIPPSPGHLVRLVRTMKDEKIKVLIYAPWNDQKLAEKIAEEAGAKPVLLAQMVGGVKGADSYIGALEYNIKTLSQALRQ
ncbi:MAG: zinc ABC transporter substrate-binding protein [Chloroflexi bacterium]|nr:MAG: zinc ABC transporter substrate-binding protein [Chloroflexota bacterium]